VRFVWNWALRARTDAFRAGERMGYPATDKALTALKATPEHVWLIDILPRLKAGDSHGAILPRPKG
jgi:putative transposase